MSVATQIALSNTTLGPLKRAYKDIKLRNGPPLIAAAVPLKCGKGGACNAVAEEDKAFQTEVSKWKFITAVLLTLCSWCNFRYRGEQCV